MPYQKYILISLLAVIILRLYNNYRTFGKKSSWKITSKRWFIVDNFGRKFIFIERREGSSLKPFRDLLNKAHEEGLECPNPEEWKVVSAIRDLAPGFWYSNIHLMSEFFTENNSIPRTVIQVNSISVGCGIRYVFVSKK